MFYDKQIKYLDMYEKGEKVQNAGFVRLEARGDNVNIQIRAEKLRHTDVGTVQLWLLGKDKEAVLGELLLDKGRGVQEFTDLSLKDIAGGISYEELYELNLKLPGERLLRCTVKEKETAQEQKRVMDEVISEAIMFQNPTQEPGSMSENMPPLVPWPEYEPEPESSLEKAVPKEAWPEETTESENASEESKYQDFWQEYNSERKSSSVGMSTLVPQYTLEPEDTPVSEPKRVREPERRPEQMPPAMSEAKGVWEPERRPEQMPPEMSEAKGVWEPERRPEQIPPMMPESKNLWEPAPVLRPIPSAPIQERLAATTKWQQLSNIYPHIRPFQDGRDYLKIKPEDFVVLAKKYYPLTTNSFLKHGYYNYEHLILTREIRKDGERFYIGVPGNFYEKEKQVAVLFGFESFEGKEEPASNGDFGYYMISVEI